MIARLISRPCAMAFVGAKTGTISTQECIYWLFSKRRFSEMGIALLLLSWGVELVGGGWCVYTFWMVEKWQALLAQLELTEAQSGSFLGIAQSAHPASGPTRPNVLTNTAVGLLVGLLNGLLLAILLEQLDTRVRTEEALTQVVDWPVLATVWRQDSSKKDKLKNEALVNPPPHSTNVESFRILRTNIGFSVVKKPLRKNIMK